MRSTRLIFALALVFLCKWRVTVAAPAPGFDDEILAFEAADRSAAPPKGAILFVGSSSIRRWTTLAKDFPEHVVINRGFGGSEVADSVRLANRIVIPYAPRLIVFYAGGNDINAGKTPTQVAADFQAFVVAIHTQLPATRIAYVSIAPNPARWAQVDKVREANRLIAAAVAKNQKLVFINVFPQMLGADGLPLPGIFIDDRLHMNEAGYALWVRIIKPYLGPPDIAGKHLPVKN